MRLRQDLVPIKNTCQVEEEAIIISINHVREVAVRPVNTIQAKKIGIAQIERRTAGITF